jgi:hypothetical protein
MATLIAYWKGSTRRRLLRGLAGLAACLAPLVMLALNPSVAIRMLEWGLSRKRANRQTTAATQPQPPASTAQPVGTPETAFPSGAAAERAEESLNTGVLHPAIAASIGAPRLASPVSETARQTLAMGGSDEGSLAVLHRVLDLLKSGRERFGRIPSYSATFSKRERIGGETTDLSTLEIKVRHQPFAVYLKVLEGHSLGREVLYVDGENDGSMLVRMGGVKGRFIPAFKVDASGSIAQNESRYPITKAGILGLAESMIAHREMELANQVYAHARQEADGVVDGRACAVFSFLFDNAERSPDYRKSIQYLDRQWNVPLQVENYGWPEPGQHLEGAALDEGTLIEYYKYSNIVADGHLTGDDFSPSNPEYRFRR